MQLDPPSSKTEAELLDERMLDTIAWVLPGVAAIFVVFFFYNAVDLPPGVRGLTMAYDAVLVVVAMAGHRLLRLGWVPPGWIHATGMVLVVGVIGNVLLVMGLLGAPIYTVYVDVIVIGVGVSMLRTSWTAATLTIVAVLWLPVAMLTPQDPQDLVRYGFTLLVSIVVSVIVHGARLQTERRVIAQGLALRAALQAAEQVRNELDDEVDRRTADLVATNRALTREIRERQRAEDTADTLAEQLVHAQRLESLGQLAGGVAHDFNNLLTAIAGNLDEVLDETSLEGEDLVALTEARRAADRAAELTRQLLVFSRRQVLQTGPVELGQLVEETRRMLDRLIGPSIRMQVLRSEPELWVEGDRTQLEQVLVNLVVNARDAMPEGGQLEIGLDGSELDEQRWVHVRVVDTGSGMDRATQARIFEPFFTTKDVGKGTGLGLATAYGIVHQHGGRLSVASEPGIGTTFEVWLPRSSMGTLEDPVRPEPLPATGHETILLVEDDDTVRRLADRLLRHLGYQVVSARSADEAEAAVVDQLDAIDLLFTDIQMAGRSGIQLAEALREKRPDLRVLMCTGYADDTLRSELPEHTQLLGKPYTRGSLAQALRRALDDPD